MADDQLDGLVVTVRDVRAARMCIRGSRQFFIRHGLDWDDFLKNGIPGRVLADTGDAMALKVVEVARNGRQ